MARVPAGKMDVDRPQILREGKEMPLSKKSGDPFLSSRGAKFRYHVVYCFRKYSFYSPARLRN